MKKMLLSVITVIMLIVGSVSVFAEERSNDVTVFQGENITEISPKALLCINCGASMVMKQDRGSYYFYKNVACTHKAFGQDKIYRRKVEKYYQCPQCDTRRDIGTSYEEKVECHGYY